jgi:DNA-binding protein H-NS
MQQNVTYESLMNEISSLVKQVQKIQVVDIVDDIKNKIKTYGLTPKDLNLEVEQEVKKVIHTRRKPDPKYKDPVSGKTWSGRGKTPVWMKQSLSQGISKETFALCS